MTSGLFHIVSFPVNSEVCLSESWIREAMPISCQLPVEVHMNRTFSRRLTNLGRTSNEFCVDLVVSG